MATTSTSRQKKHVSFAEPIATTEEISAENDTVVVNIMDELDEQVEDVMKQLDKMHMESLRCMDMSNQANQQRLHGYGVRGDAFERLLQLVPTVSAIAELDRAQVQLEATFDELMISWVAKMQKMGAQLPPKKSEGTVQLPPNNSSNTGQLLPKESENNDQLPLTDLSDAVQMKAKPISA